MSYLATKLGQRGQNHRGRMSPRLSHTHTLQKQPFITTTSSSSSSSSSASLKSERLCLPSPSQPGVLTKKLFATLVASRCLGCRYQPTTTTTTKTPPLLLHAHI